MFILFLFLVSKSKIFHLFIIKLTVVSFKYYSEGGVLVQFRHTAAVQYYYYIIIVMDLMQHEEDSVIIQWIKHCV